jgi:hypothetical protein
LPAAAEAVQKLPISHKSAHGWRTVYAASAAEIQSTPGRGRRKDREFRPSTYSTSASLGRDRKDPRRPGIRNTDGPIFGRIGKNAAKCDRRALGLAR